MYTSESQKYFGIHGSAPPREKSGEQGKETNPLSVDVSHGHVHCAAVAPEAARMEREPTGQEDHLGKEGVDT
jgi:hypothetical protein